MFERNLCFFVSLDERTRDTVKICHESRGEAADESRLPVSWELEFSPGSTRQQFIKYSRKKLHETKANNTVF